jgi:hypothetical protein
MPKVRNPKQDQSVGCLKKKKKLAQRRKTTDTNGLLPASLSLPFFTADLNGKSDPYCVIGVIDSSNGQWIGRPTKTAVRFTSISLSFSRCLLFQYIHQILFFRRFAD